jgi:hypothetical protein
MNLEKLTCTHIVKKFLIVSQPLGSFPCSQKPAILTQSSQNIILAPRAQVVNGESREETYTHFSEAFFTFQLPHGLTAHWSMQLHVPSEQHLLTACSRALLDKLTGSQLVKKFPAFFETRRFNTVFTTARHLSLS